MAVRPQLSLNRNPQSNSFKSPILVPTGNLTRQPSNLQQEGRAPVRAIANGRSERRTSISGERPMLWTITIILFILWIVGLVSSYTLGGWIHILLVLAIIVLIFNLMSGRRAL
jgi:hypothetical protein